MHSYGDGLAYCVQLILLLQFYGASCSYVVAYAGLLDLVWSIYFNYSIYIYLAIAIYTIVVIPLALFRSMAKLRFTSFLGFSCSMYLSLVTFIEYFILCNDIFLRQGGDYDNSNKFTFSTCFWSNNFTKNVLSYNNLFPTNIFSGFITTFPLNTFAYICHPYMLPVYVELKIVQFIE